MRTVRGLHGGAGLGVGMRVMRVSVNVRDAEAVSASCLRSAAFHDRLSRVSRYGTVDTAPVIGPCPRTILGLAQGTGV